MHRVEHAAGDLCRVTQPVLRRQRQGAKSAETTKPTEQAGSARDATGPAPNAASPGVWRRFAPGEVRPRLPFARERGTTDLFLPVPYRTNRGTQSAPIHQPTPGTGSFSRPMSQSNPSEIPPTSAHDRGKMCLSPSGQHQTPTGTQSAPIRQPTPGTGSFSRPPPQSNPIEIPPISAHDRGKMCLSPSGPHQTPTGTQSAPIRQPTPGTGSFSRPPPQSNPIEIPPTSAHDRGKMCLSPCRAAQDAHRNPIRAHPPTHVPPCPSLITVSTLFRGAIRAEDGARRCRPVPRGGNPSRWQDCPVTEPGWVAFRWRWASCRAWGRPKKSW